MQKDKEKEISSSVWLAQHSKAGRNMQHLSHKRLSSIKSLKLKRGNLPTFSSGLKFTKLHYHGDLIWQFSGMEEREIADTVTI